MWWKIQVIWNKLSEIGGKNLQKKVQNANEVELHVQISSLWLLFQPLHIESFSILLLKHIFHGFK